MEDFYIGQIFEDEYPPEAAIWCNENSCFLQEENKNNKRVFIITFYEPIIESLEDLLPSREELSEAVAELGALVSALYESK